MEIFVVCRWLFDCHIERRLLYRRVSRRAHVQVGARARKRAENEREAQPFVKRTSTMFANIFRIMFVVFPTDAKLQECFLFFLSFSSYLCWWCSFSHTLVFADGGSCLEEREGRAGEE